MKLWVDEALLHYSNNTALGITYRHGRFYDAYSYRTKLLTTWTSIGAARGWLEYQATL